MDEEKFFKATETMSERVESGKSQIPEAGSVNNFKLDGVPKNSK